MVINLFLKTSSQTQIKLQTQLQNTVALNKMNSIVAKAKDELKVQNPVFPKNPDKQSTAPQECFIKLKLAMDQMFSILLTKTASKSHISWKRLVLVSFYVFS